MRFILVTSLVFLVVAVSMIPSSHQVQFGGTFIGTITASDGIVIGADSRSTFIDDAGRSLGYIDGTQKVHVSNTTGVAVSGLTNVEGELFNSFVEKNAFLLQRGPDEALFGMSAWMPFRNNNGVLLLSAGYVQGKPMICMRSPTQPQDCQTSGMLTNHQSPSLQAWIAAQHVPPTSIAAAAALKRAIEEAAAADVKIGGPITIFQLRPDGGPIAIERPSLPPWKTMCDIIRDHRAGKARIMPTGSQAELDRLLAGLACPR